MLTLTPRVLGTSYCVLLLQVLCRMKLLSGVKQALSSGSSSRGSGSCSEDNGSQDSLRSSSFIPLPHRTVGSSRYLAHDVVPEATNGDTSRRCRSMSLSASESLVTLMYMM
jgi:hypothetical protein